MIIKIEKTNVIRNYGKENIKIMCEKRKYENRKVQIFRKSAQI